MRDTMYQTMDDAHDERQSRYTADLKTCRAEGEQYVRSYLISVLKVVTEALESYGDQPLEHDMTFDEYAISALDDILIGDRLSALVGKTLAARTDCGHHAINVVADEFRHFEI